MICVPLRCPICFSIIERQSRNGFVVLIVRLCLLGVFGDTILPNTQRLFFKNLPLPLNGGGAIAPEIGEVFCRHYFRRGSEGLLRISFTPELPSPARRGKGRGWGFGKGAIIHALGIIATHVIQTGARGPYRVIRSVGTAATQSNYCWMDTLQRRKSAGRKEDPTMERAAVGLGFFAHTGGYMERAK